MRDPIHHWSATRIAEAVRQRDLSAREVTQAILDRIRVVDPTIVAYATVDADGALAAADRIDQRIARGESTGPLSGVPFSVKDLIPTAGLETAYGSHLFAGNVPAVDAAAVARLRAAGAVLLGKTTTPEFGHKALTSSPRYGHTRNPWQGSRSPGGSCGGSAAAVAAGLGPVSLTTDGSGSARIPASACGVLGLKPTLGLIPNEMAVELFTNFVTLGLATRTVADLARSLQATSGAFDADPWSRGAQPADYLAALSLMPSGLKGLRVRVIERMGNQRIADSVRMALHRTAGALEAAGASLMTDDESLDSGRATMVTMMRAYQSIRLRPMLAAHRHRMDPSLVEALEEGAGQSLEAVQRAPADRSALYRRVEALFATSDLLLTPTVSAPPPPVDIRHDEPLVIDGQAIGPLRAEWYCYTGLFNLTGHPGLSVPAGFDADCVPIGVQLVSRWHDESLLLRCAAWLESSAPWAHYWPDLRHADGHLPYPRTAP